MQSPADNRLGIFDTVAPSSTRPEQSYVSEASFIAFLPKLLVIVSALTLMVNGALPQLEMAFTGGGLPFAPRQLSFLVMALVAMLLMKGRFQSSPLLPITVALASYFVMEALYLHLGKDISYRGIRAALDLFVFLALVGAASAVPLQIKSSQVLACLSAITCACLAVSVAQYATNSPVVRTQSNDGDFHVQSYQFLDQTRAFSLFSNGLEAGFFYCLMGGIATSMLLRWGTKRMGLLLFVASAFGCYATLTRLAMVGFFVTVLSTFVLSRKSLIKIRKLLPAFGLVCAMLLIGEGLHTAGGAGRTDLASVSSLDTRVVAWGVFANKFISGSRADMLFGTGQAGYSPYNVPNRLENAAPIPIDNAFLLTLLSAGVFGLLLLVATYCYLWSFLMRRVDALDEHLVRGISGMFATLPFFCCINDLPGQMVLPLLFVVSLRTQEPVAAREVGVIKQASPRGLREDGFANTGWEHLRQRHPPGSYVCGVDRLTCFADPSASG